MVALALAACAVVVFGLVLLNIHVAQTSFRLADLQARALEQESAYRRLRFELASAESPEKVAKMARDLGLVPPERQEFIEGGVAFSRGREERVTAAGGRSG